VGGTLTPEGEESLEIGFFSDEKLASLNVSTIGRTLLEARRSAFQKPATG